MVQNSRLEEVDKLINCIESNKGANHKETDEILTIAINSALNINETSTKVVLDQYIKRIHSIEMKIACHIHIGQLKAAYLLAIQNNRLNDVRKIYRQAEATNQMYIKTLCEKRLNLKK